MRVRGACAAEETRLLTLVTQPDGSARRIPFVTLLLLAGSVWLLSQHWEAMTRAQGEAALLHEQAVAYFEKNPFVAVDERFEQKVGTERIETARSEFASSRAKLGMPAVPEAIQARTQRRFDGMLEQARAHLEQIPAQRLGLSSVGAQPAANYLAHAVVHPSVAALVLTAAVLLLVGIVLEDVWGSVVMAVFVTVAAAATGVASSHLVSGVWYGSCGVVGALLGAALVRQWSVGSPRLLGFLPLPAWLLVGLWLGAELAITELRGAEALPLHPPLVHVAAIGIGIGLGLAVRALGFEEVLASRWDEGEAVSPVYEKAMELRERGLVDKAYALLKAEYARDASNPDVALGLWDLCRTRGVPEEGVPMALAVVEEHLREGAGPAAAKQWGEVADQVPASQIQMTGALAARVADACFGDDCPGHALDALRVAVASSQRMPTPMAVRAAQLAHPHDVHVARHAAAIAFSDPALGSVERSALLDLVGGEVELSEFETVASLPGFDDAMDQGYGAVDFGEDAASDDGEALETADGPAAHPPDAAEPGGDLVDDALEDHIDLEGLDPNALDLDDLDASDTPYSDAPGQAEPEVEDGVVSHGEVALDALSVEAAAGPAEAPESRSLDAAPEPPLGAVSLVEADVVADDVPAAVLLDDGPGADQTVAATAVLRPLTCVEATPGELGGQALTIRADDGRALQVAWERVEAIAVAAVAGLGPKPVLLIDLALNWRDLGSGRDGAASELRVLRMRSDRFDPRKLVDTPEPLSALRELVQLLLDASGATPLPDASSAAGQPFAVFESLEDYERDVLGACRT